MVVMSYSSPLYTAGDSFADGPRLPRLSGNEPQPLQDLPKILVVDDEKKITDTVSEILSLAGFQVESAYDGWAALEVVQRFQPDHLLADVLMPNMNGVDLAIAVQKLFPSVRILLFSGQVGISEILLDAQRCGYEFELLAKPVHPLKLIQAIKDQK